MQKLFVKMPDKTIKTVHVHRSFQDISGKHIFLHHTGVWGYRDGTPVKSAAELAIVPQPHYRVAMAWWNRVGKEMSAQFYSQKAEAEIQGAGDFQEQLAADEHNTQLDSVLYSRRAVVGGKLRGAVSDPKPWMEFGFSRRPDWWGQAKEISFPDFRYIMLEYEEDAREPDARNEDGPVAAPFPEENIPAGAEIQEKG